MSALYPLDIIGVFAFAVFGARKALGQRFDIFGVLGCAFLTAFGGGTIREIILNGQPVYLHDTSYLCVVVAGAAFALATESSFHKINKIMLVLDAIGLAVFAYIGASRAADAGLGLTAMGIFATLTAAGGGILTDIVCRKRPSVFFHDFYTLPAMLLALAYFLLGDAARHMGVAYALIGSTCLARVLFLYVRSGQRKLRPVHAWRLLLAKNF